MNNDIPVNKTNKLSINGGDNEKQIGTMIFGLGQLELEFGTMLGHRGKKLVVSPECHHHFPNVEKKTVKQKPCRENL